MFAREDDIPFNLNHGSQDFFLRELERSVRRSLFLCSPERHDNPGECRGRFIDVTLTRFFADDDFSNHQVFAAVRDILNLLPTTIEHSRRILHYIFSGSVYDGVRKFKAGLAASEQCPHCHDRNTFLHAVRNCSIQQSPEFDEEFADTTWCTGIFFESDRFSNLRATQHQQDIQNLPPPQVLPPEHSNVFVDGSCFRSCSKRISRAAAAVHVPNFCNFACELPGLDHSSQRSEITALALALQMFHGDLTIYSDCSSVVKGFDILKHDGFNPVSLSSWDNFDLWVEVCRLASSHPGSVAIHKVSAHGRDRSQDPYLTEGNRQANDLAFDCAKQSFQQCATDILPEIKNAVRLQVHLISTFYMQSGNSPEEEREQASGTQDSRGFTPRCSCVPGHRFRKKGRMFCTCPASQSLSPDLNVEHVS